MAASRRGFLRAAITVGLVASIIKGRVIDDGIVLESIAHPTWQTRIWFEQRGQSFEMKCQRIMSDNTWLDWRDDLDSKVVRHVSVVDKFVTDDELRELWDAAGPLVELHLS